MGYVPTHMGFAGTPLTLKVRGRGLSAKVVKLPFVPTSYYRPRRRHRMTRHFTKDHEWIEVNGDTATVGITQYAQHQLGDVVYVELPDIGATLVQHAEAAVVESVKAASDVFSPADGTVSEVNTGLAEDPAGINGDPEGNAWMFRMTLSKPDQIEALMDAGAYEAFCAGLG